MSEKYIDIKSDADKAKKVYRAAVDGVRKLDEGLKKKRAYREVFQQDAVGLRYKLREYCERLMFYNPLLYGRKAEEVLWRKVFYDIIQIIKKNRRHVRVGSSLETAYRTHLSSAWGYYYHLLFRLQRDFNLKLDTKIDFPLIPDNNPGRYVKSSRRKEVTLGMHDWAMKAVHRCLICLGDIARYQQDFDAGLSGSAAERFYQQALMLNPDMGVAHNQLGTLAASRYFNCEAAYHYIRCLACDVPFEGAEGNLQRLFEKNQKRFRDLRTEPSRQTNIPKEQCYQDLKSFFVRFLQLLKVLYDTDKCDNTEIQDCCQTTLQSFNHCMFYEPVSYSEDLSEENIHYMEDDIVFKIVVICIATIHILQKRGSRKVTAATAFLLALFSHILNHVVIRLQGALYEKENPNKILQSNNQQYTDINGDDSESDKSSSLTDTTTTTLKNGHIKHDHLNTSKLSQDETTGKIEKKTQKSTKTRSRNLRRRRPRSSKLVVSDDSDLSDISDLSEGGDDIRDELSDDSEDDTVGFYEDSDSDMSDSLMKSQELEAGFSANADQDNPISAIENVINNQQSAEYLPSVFHGNDQSKIWSDITKTDSLASFSSELFSSSVPFLGVNFKLSQQQDEVDNDVIQGKKQVPIPPGFAKSSEAKHVEEISEKLANFVIETDTEASVTATEVENSQDSDNDVSDDDGSSGDEMDKIRSSSTEEKDSQHQQNIIDVIQCEGLLSVVKIMSDWMYCNSKVIMTCANSSQSVWCRLSVLLNFLPHESTFLNHDQCWQEDLQSVLKIDTPLEWKQKMYLREDINLIKFSPLKQVHENLDKKYNIKLTELQESFLRTCCLRQFGYFLSSLDNLQFTYNNEKCLFIGPAQPDSQDETEEIAMEKMADTETRRNQLMRDMAQLRLQAEVSELEGRVSMTESVPFPPYVIPDTTCLSTSLPLIKRLSLSNRSILVIPLAVIDNLDFQKKESHGARDAIRWLEAEFKKGNRYIRAQKNSEKLQTVQARHLKKKNRETWCILEMISCALYLSQQGGDFGTDTVIAILTTSGFNSVKHPMVKQALATSKLEGVSVENISEFVNKWSEMLNKG